MSLLHCPILPAKAPTCLSANRYSSSLVVFQCCNNPITNNTRFKFSTIVSALPDSYKHSSISSFSQVKALRPFFVLYFVLIALWDYIRYLVIVVVLFSYSIGPNIYVSQFVFREVKQFLFIWKLCKMYYYKIIDKWNI